MLLLRTPSPFRSLSQGLIACKGLLAVTLEFKTDLALASMDLSVCVCVRKTNPMLPGLLDLISSNYQETNILNNLTKVSSQYISRYIYIYIYSFLC